MPRDGLVVSATAEEEEILETMVKVGDEVEINSIRTRSEPSPVAPQQKEIKYTKRS